MAQLRLLSVRQPWASFLVHGIKKLEVRSWKTDYRGPVAIRASGKIGLETEDNLLISKAVYLAYDRLVAKADVSEDWRAEMRATLPIGGVIGLVTLTDCRPMTEWAKMRWNKVEQQVSFGGRKRQPPDLYGFRMINPVLVTGKPIAAPGLLNLVKWSSRNAQVVRYCRNAEQ